MRAGIGGGWRWFGTGDAIEPDIDPWLVAIDAFFLVVDVFQRGELGGYGDFDEIILGAGGAAPADLGVVLGDEDDLRGLRIGAAIEVGDVHSSDFLCVRLAGQKLDELKAAGEIAAGPVGAGFDGGMGDAVDDANIHFSIGAEHDAGELGGGVLLGELDAFAVDEPVVVVPFDQGNWRAVIAIDLDGVGRSLVINAPNLIDLLDPGVGFEEVVGIDQELVIEGGMEANGPGVFDDFLGQEIAHPRRAILQNDIGRTSGEDQIALDVGAHDVKECEKAAEDEDKDGKMNCPATGDARGLRGVFFGRSGRGFLGF